MARLLLLFFIPTILLGSLSVSPIPSHTWADSSRICTEEPDLVRFFNNVEGTFVLSNTETARTVCHNQERARTRFLPASTYKIPNTLIALETGVATGSNFPLAWDSTIAPRQPWWPAIWNQNHTLRTALADSVVWYYQELARRIGAPRMQKYLDQFAYGNRNISGAIDQFWLSGGLRTSAEEQVAFLRHFYFDELGLSERTTQTAKGLLLLEQTAKYRLSGKMGWAGLGDSHAPQIGWFVGYLERDATVHFFATNIDIKTREDAAARLSITKAILREFGLLSD